MFRSSNQGDHWESINIGLNGKIIFSLLIDANNNLYTGTENEVFRSEDNGESWVSSNAGITNSSVISLAINLKGYLFAGRETGVARSRKSAMNSRALKFVSQGFEIE